MRFAVAQSGGPTCAINASLAGVCLAAMEQREPITVYGAQYGIEGVMERKWVHLNEILSDPRQQRLLRQTPAAALGSCRCHLPPAAQNDKMYRKIKENLEEKAIDAFFYIGGNDSMDTVAKLSAWLQEQGSPIRVIGVPKTIDNDLVLTDHTPGFGSAVKYLNTTLSEIIRDCSVYAVKSVTICEIMGRDAGWLTASACVLQENAPQLIYLPESPFSVAGFLEDVCSALETHSSVVCAVSEGVRLPNAEQYRSGANDSFGHAYLSGIGKYLEGKVMQEIGCKVRSVELNIMQRCSAHLAASVDLDEAEQCGRKAVSLALAGETGKMVTMQREASTQEYRIRYDAVEAASTANLIRTVPVEWLTPAGNQVRPEAAQYFLPLMQGEVSPILQNGLPVHFRL